MLRNGFDTDLAAGLDVEDAGWHRVAFAPDRAEGVRAFAQKRPPVWSVPRLTKVRPDVSRRPPSGGG